jgi:hypothetical protein
MAGFDITKKKAFVCDLDGTLFMGPDPIKPAVDFVIESTKSGRFSFLRRLPEEREGLRGQARS